MRNNISQTIVLIIFFKNNRYLCILLVLLLNHKSIFSQATGDAKEDFLYGEYYLAQGLYGEALPFYLSALEQDTGNSNLNYRVGLCYMKQIGEQHKALPYLQRSVKEINPNYIEGKFKNTGAPYEAWLLLGDAYHRANNLMEASYAYHKYLDLVGTSDKDRSDLIRKRIEGLGISLEYQRTSSNVKLINLGSIINSRFSDYDPVLSGDQKTLIYTQFWETYDKIFISKLSDIGWSVPVEITKQVGSQGDCYTSALSFDGSELYLIKNDEFNSDIFVSRLVKGKWTKMQPVQGKVNTRHQETSCSISKDGYTLYFSSNRPGGEGGFDIYSAEKTINGWSLIKNLGKYINTNDNEEAPYISEDGKVLYFSSDGYITVGNMDILYSEQDPEGNWQTTINMGVPVNTVDDDLFFVYFKETKTGYISRDIPEGYGKNDIYMVQNSSEPVKIYDTIPPVIEDIANINTYADTAGITQADVRDEKVNDLAISEENINPSIENHAEVKKEETYQPAYSTNESQSLLNKNSSNYKDISSFKNIDSARVYTIQIFALKNHRQASKIRLSPLVISAGDDGFYRYTYGEYKGISNALSHLKKIRKKGFPDAFIRNIRTVQNYSKQN